MKLGAFTVFKKEIARFFGDKRLLFTSVIMPGLLIYLIYSVMGNSLNSMMSDQTSSFKAAAVDIPQSVASQLEKQGFEIENIELSEVDRAKEQIEDGDLSLCVVFPNGFENVMSEYAGGSKTDSAPNVKIYFDSADINSSHAYSVTVAMLDELEKTVSNVFDINNASQDDGYDVASEEDAAGAMLSMILPMLITVLLYSSCVALAPESIAGEKERGTLAALLITPVPRSQIILGKVLALSVMALLGGLSSFLGTFMSLPSLMQGMGDELGSISANVYGPVDYVCLIVLILTTVLLLITVISIISTLAKSVKEAGTMVLPLMLVVMLVSFMTMYQTETRTEFYWYLIPIYNTIESMAKIFSFSLDPVCIAVTAAANIVYSALGIFILTKLFNNEKVMFNS